MAEIEKRELEGRRYLVNERPVRPRQYSADPLMTEHSPTPGKAGGLFAAVFLAAALTTLGCRQPSDAQAEKHEPKRLEEELAKLSALPYLDWVPAVERGKEQEAAAGVVVHRRERISPGLNLYTPRHLPTAFLLDMDGTVLHEWSEKTTGASWQHVELVDGRSLLALVKDRRLTLMDWDSNIIWTVRGRFHHDLDIARNGDILALTRSEEMVVIHDVQVPALVDYVSVISSQGKFLREISLLDFFGHLISEERLEEIRRWAEEEGIEGRLAQQPGGGVISSGSPGDLFHANTVEILGSEVSGLWEAGDLLISMRSLDTIAVINPASTRVRWLWGPGEIEAQHHPTLLPNGNILLFDNGPRRGYSRVIELEPISRRIVWEYRAPGSFLSNSRGGNQRLPNGNTLIAESDRGRVLEVTAEGEIVWEFYCPLTRVREGRPERAAVYRMERLVDLERKVPSATRPEERNSPREES